MISQGKSGKYTNYSKHTGITKTEGQSTIDTPLNSRSEDSSENSEPSSDGMDDTTTIEGVTTLIRKFANDRLWNRYHTPRNIALAILGEVGELAELFQWSGDVDKTADDCVGGSGRKVGLAGWSKEELDKVGQEIADVSIYLLRLADVCHVRLGHVALQLVGSKGLEKCDVLFCATEKLPNA